MGILLRHTLRSLGRNKGQTAVILVTVIVVTVMIFASLSMYDMFYNISAAEYRRAAGDADILVGSHNETNVTFSVSRIRNFVRYSGDRFSHAEYFVRFGSILKTDRTTRTVLVEATDLDTYLQKHTLRYVEKYQPDPFDTDVMAYAPAIIGERFAADAGLGAGDFVEIYLPTYNMYVKMHIRYVVADEGLFASSAAINLLTDFDAVGNQGQITAAYLTLKDPADYDAAVRELEAEFPGVGVGEGNGETAAREIARNNTTLLVVGLMFVVAMMALILLTSYMIVVRNRSAEMEVFKAAGATPGQTVTILLLEVVCYGLVGGLIGVALGRLIMEVAVISLLQTARHAVTYAVWKYFVAVIVAVAVTVLSALGPAISLSRKTIRAAASQGAKQARRNRPVLFSVATLALIGVSVAVSFLDGTALIPLAALLIITAALWIAASTGYAVKAVSWLIAKLRSTGPARVAAMQVGRARSLRTITVLLSVIMAFAFVVVETVTMVRVAVTPFRTRYSADYIVNVGVHLPQNELDDFAADLKDLPGIGTVGYYHSADFYIDEIDGKAFTVYGVSDPDCLVACCAGGLSEGTLERYRSVTDPIVLSRDMALRLGASVGDRVSFIIVDEDYRNVEFSFTVAGFDETVSEYDRVAYCPYGRLELLNKTAIMLVSAREGLPAGTEGDVFVTLRDAVEARRMTTTFALPYAEWVGATRDLMSGVSTLLLLLEIAVCLVALMGVVNISVVTRYDRKRELSVFRLSGMSRSDYLGFTAAEGGILALAAAVIGLGTALAVNRLLPLMGAVVDKYMVFAAFPLSSVLSGLIGAVAFVGIWLAIALARPPEEGHKFDMLA